MRIIAKLAVLGVTIGGLGLASATTAHAGTEPKTVDMTTITIDAPFDDFDDYVRGEIQQHVANWPGWQHNWHDRDWDDDDWDDDDWDD